MEEISEDGLQFDPSLKNFIIQPEKYVLRLKGDRLIAEEKKFSTFVKRFFLRKDYDLRRIVNELRTKKFSEAKESIQKEPFTTAVNQTIKNYNSKLGILARRLFKRTNVAEFNTHQPIAQVVHDGKIAYKDLGKTGLPFKENLSDLFKAAKILPDGSRELEIFGLSETSPEAKMKLVIKEEALYDSGVLQTQLKDESHREKLEEKKGIKHYSFEFYDLQREKSPELVAEEQKGELLAQISEKIGKGEPLSDEMRTVLDIGESAEIQEVLEEQQFMHPIVLESLRTEQNKPTIKGRISEDGTIGELKSVNIHSKVLNGQKLVGIWDAFCDTMSPQEIYLEDDAKIEKEGVGSYPLRLFRLMSEPQKLSWYADAFKYTQYEKADTLLEQVAKFRDRTIADIIHDFDKVGFSETKKEKVVGILKKYVPKEELEAKNFSELITELGKKVIFEKGDIHSDIHALLTDYLEMYRDYEGSEVSLKNLKQAAAQILEARYLRKTYS